MPQIAQQDYKVIAPKPGRAFADDAAALGELKKAILKGIGFDCLIGGSMAGEYDINRVFGFYPDGSAVSYYSCSNGDIIEMGLPYTITQYQGLAAVQNAMDEADGLQSSLPNFEKSDTHLLASADSDAFVCVDGKYLTVTGSETIEALAIAETGPDEGYTVINISWEDALKLIGLPIS